MHRPSIIQAAEHTVLTRLEVCPNQVRTVDRLVVIQAILPIVVVVEKFTPRTQFAMYIIMTEIEELTKVADKNDVEAQVRLGDILSDTDNGYFDKDLAIHWYTRAVYYNGNDYAQQRLYDLTGGINYWCD